MWASIWSDIKENYLSSWHFIFVCPILFLIPALVEFAQHVVEIQIGMYDGGDAAVAVADNDERLRWGFVKALSIALPGYWFVRYLGFDRDASAARRIEWPAIGLWSVIFALSALQIWLGLFGPSLESLSGMSTEQSALMKGILMLALTVLGIYFTTWQVAWPLGNVRIGPIQSIKIMNGHFWRAVIYTLAGIIPLMIVHYAFGYGAMGMPIWLVWMMMVLDALVVGLLSLTMVGSIFFAARFATTAKSVSLLPD
jgi:hypothetical protein